MGHYGGFFRFRPLIFFHEDKNTRNGGRFKSQTSKDGSQPATRRKCSFHIHLEQKANKIVDGAELAG